jgi:hypothetical protein
MLLAAPFNNPNLAFPVSASAGSNKSYKGSSGRGSFGPGSTSGKYSGVAGIHRNDDSKKAADTLDLDGFLAEANASEIRRLGTRGNKN